MLCWLIIDS